MLVSSPNVILCGWLGSTHQLATTTPTQLLHVIPTYLWLPTQRYCRSSGPCRRASGSPVPGARRKSHQSLCQDGWTTFAVYTPCRQETVKKKKNPKHQTTPRQSQTFLNLKMLSKILITSTLGLWKDVLSLYAYFLPPVKSPSDQALTSKSTL